MSETQSQLTGEISSARIIGSKTGSASLEVSGTFTATGLKISTLQLGFLDQPLQVVSLEDVDDSEHVYTFSTVLNITTSLDPSMIPVAFLAFLEDGRTVSGEFLVQPEIELENDDSPPQTTEARKGEERSPFKQDYCSIPELLASNFWTSGRTITFPIHNSPDVSVFFHLRDTSYRSVHTLLMLSEIQSPGIEVFLFYEIDNVLNELLLRVHGARVTPIAKGTLAATLNSAAHAASGEKILFIHEGIYFSQSSLQAAVDAFNSPKNIGAVGGPIISADNTLFEAGGTMWPDGALSPWGNGIVPELSLFRFSRPVDFFSDHFLLVKRELFNSLNGLSASYSTALGAFTDFCFRVQREDHQIWFDPSVLISTSYRAEDAKLYFQQADADRELFEAHLATELSIRNPPEERFFLQGAMSSKQMRALILTAELPAIEISPATHAVKSLVQALSDLEITPTVLSLDEIPSDPLFLTIFPTLDAELFSFLDESMTLPFLAGRSSYYDLVISVGDGTREFLISTPDISETFKSQSRHWHLPLSLGDEEALESLARFLSTDDIPGLTSKRAILLTDQSSKHEEISSIEEFENIIPVSLPVAPSTHLTHQESRGIILPVYGKKQSAEFDGVNWFLNHIFPVICAREGWKEVFDQPFGNPVFCFSEQFAPPASPSLLSRVSNLPIENFSSQIFERSKIAVYPVRETPALYPTGILLAAAAGVPIVTTPEMASRLGWKHHQELLVASTVDQFADCCEMLLSDTVLWEKLRQRCLEKLRVSHSREQFATQVARATGRLRFVSKSLIETSTIETHDVTPHANPELLLL